MNLTPSGPGLDRDIAARLRHTAEGLSSDKVYYFRVTAIGAAGASPVSDQANAKAA